MKTILIITLALIGGFIGWHLGFICSDAYASTTEQGAILTPSDVITINMLPYCICVLGALAGFMVAEIIKDRINKP